MQEEVREGLVVKDNEVFNASPQWLPTTLMLLFEIIRVFYHFEENSENVFKLKDYQKPLVLQERETLAAKIPVELPMKQACCNSNVPL